MKLKLLSLFTLSALFIHGQENPFESIGKEGKILTLSNGKYKEIHTGDTLQQIGSAIVNMKSGTIYGWVETDTLYSEANLDPTIISRWYSLDPLAAKYPAISPYAFCVNNPIYFVDPDGQDIKPANKEADALIAGLAQKYGKALNIEVGNYDKSDPNNLSLKQTFYVSKNSTLSKKAIKSALKKNDIKTTKENIDEAYAFYLGLRDDKVIEVSVVTIGAQTQATTRSPENTTGGSYAGDKPLQTDNAEYDEFYGILQNTGLTPELGDALFNGTPTSSGTEIKPDNKGTDWVYFRNENAATFSSAGNTKGHLIINITNKNEDGQINTLEQALPEVTKTTSGTEAKSEKK
ncbi:MAG: hypothetical protein ACO1O6_15130 [Bacteroidota bacterium]